MPHVPLGGRFRENECTWATTTESARVDTDDADMGGDVEADGPPQEEEVALPSVDRVRDAIPAAPAPAAEVAA